MTKLLGVESSNTYVAYERNPTIDKKTGEVKENNSLPPWDKLIDFSDRMLISLDWLAGRPTKEMWSPDLLAPMRTALRMHVSNHSSFPEDSSERLCELLRWTHNFDRKRYGVEILAGVAFVGRPEMKKILVGKNLKLGKPTPDYLADFWHLSAAWLLTGTGHPYMLDPTPYLPLLHAIEEQGITPETILRHADILRQLQESYEGTRAPRE